VSTLLDTPVVTPLAVGYAATVIADGPVAYYRLGDGGGSAIDQMGGPNGTFQGAITVGPNLLPVSAGASFTFNGATYISVPDSPATRLGAGAWTIEGWGRLTASPSYFSTIDTNNRPYAFYFQSLNTGFVGAGGTSSSGLPALPAVSLNTPFYFVCSVDASTNCVIYINGTANASTLSGHGSTNSAIGFGIGFTSSSLGEAGWVGQLQEMALYNKVLSAAQVSAHYAAASVASASGTVAAIADTRHTRTRTGGKGR
jgi:hypothetical protein